MAKNFLPRTEFRVAYWNQRLSQQAFLPENFLSSTKIRTPIQAKAKLFADSIPYPLMLLLFNLFLFFLPLGLR